MNEPLYLLLFNLHEAIWATGFYAGAIEYGSLNDTDKDRLTALHLDTLEKRADAKAALVKYVKGLQAERGEGK